MAKSRRKKFPHINIKNLTARERQVFVLIVDKGAKNMEIARALGLTPRTAKFHAANVLKKLGYADRGKLIAGWYTQLECWTKRLAAA